jgi:hypothetical protein
VRRGPSTETPVRFLVIIARHASDLATELTKSFLDDPRVQVLVDRRRDERRTSSTRWQPERRETERRRVLDYWEDTRQHPVVIVPTWKKSAPLPAPLAASDEDRTMATTDSTIHTPRNLETWIRESQHMIAEVLPALLEESHELRRRADSAEAAATRRQREIEDLQMEVARLGNEIDRLGKERANLVVTVERGMTSIARLAAEVLTALKER